MIKFKPEVRIRYFDEPILVILKQASLWSARTNIDVEINSIDDGQHGASTLHGLSLAIDLDTEGDKPADLESLYQWMRRRIPEGYDVIHEKDHVHCERDVKRPESRL